jgi:hypothetical protein
MMRGSPVSGKRARRAGSPGGGPRPGGPLIASFNPEMRECVGDAEVHQLPDETAAPLEDVVDRPDGRRKLGDPDAPQIPHHHVWRIALHNSL